MVTSPETVNPATERLRQSLKSAGLSQKWLVKYPVTAIVSGPGKPKSIGERMLLDLIVRQLTREKPRYIVVYQRDQKLGHIRPDGVFVFTGAKKPKELVAWLEATYNGLRHEPVQARRHRGVEYRLSQELSVIAHDAQRLIAD